MANHNFEDIQKLLNDKKMSNKLLDFTDLTLTDDDKAEFNILPDITQCVVDSKLGARWKYRTDEYHYIESILDSIMAGEDLCEYETYLNYHENIAGGEWEKYECDGEEWERRYQEWQDVQDELYKTWDYKKTLMKEIRYKRIQNAVNVIGEAWLRAKWSPRTKIGRKHMNDLYDDNGLE